MTIRLIAAVLVLVAVSPVQAQGDVKRGAEAFRQCVACHSLDPGYHLTGPSLFSVIGRPAGKARGFRRYSEALKASEFSWTRKALDQWLQDPEKMVPGTTMQIRPIADAAVRQDIIAFLENREPSGAVDEGESRMPDLKQIPPGRQVTKIRYCPDAYEVTVATGATYSLWEFNLRFKSDSSSRGPSKGRPVLVGQGMRGDRAQIVFSAPAEISSFIKEKCSDD